MSGIDFHMENSNSNPGLNQSNSVHIVKCRPILDISKKTRAFVDLSIGPFLMHGFALVENKNGDLWLAPPSNFKKDNNGNSKNYPIVEIDRTFDEKLRKAVVQRYRAEMRELAGKPTQQNPPTDHAPFQADDNDIPF